MDKLKHKTVVIDTNVWLSLLISQNSGSLQKLLTYVFNNCLLVSSEETLEELLQAREKKKLLKYLKKEMITELIRIIIDKATMVEIKTNVQACRDLNDDKFLDLAISAKADYIITGDKDLLEMNPFEGISIINPSEALSL